MKRLLALLLAISCVLSMTACSKKPEKEEPYIPPVQGGYFQETEPVDTEPVSTTMPEITEPPETEPVIEETEPVVEETEPAPTEPELTFIEEARLEHEGNELYFKYNLLSDSQKELYLMACEAVEAGNKTFYLGDLKIDVDPAQEALKAMWYDHPEYFWYTSQYTINYMETKAFSVELSYYPELMSKFETNKIAFQRVVDALVERAQEKSSVLDQERLIHDYIAKSTQYIETPLDQTAWSCLIERKTVCAGYARAFQVVMMELGIPCYLVTGDVVSSDGTVERHAWNAVKIVDAFYAMDLTSNDCDEKDCILYNKYNFAYSSFPGQYVVDEDSVAFPDCTETRYSFKNTYGIDENIASAMSWADSSTVIYSLEEYKVFHEQTCRYNGFGEWQCKYVVAGEDVMRQIEEYIQACEYLDTYITDIAKFNNISSFQIQESATRTIFEDVYGVTHTVVLTGQ